MKQNITIEQLQELSLEQQNKLRELWQPKPYDQVTYTYKYYDEWITSKIIIKGLYNENPTKLEEISGLKGECVFLKSKCLPLLNIGQMIEILDRDHVLEMTILEIRVWLRGDIRTIKVYKGDLCDTLFEAIKSI